jgi:hypothetical protein
LFELVVSSAFDAEVVDAGGSGAGRVVDGAGHDNAPTNYGDVVELAQANVARLRAPLESAAMREFVAALPSINRLAEQSPGFVWRLRSEHEHGLSVATEDGKLVFVNVSVWTSYDQLHAYVYRSAHGGFTRRRREWFDPTPQPSTALWWVPTGDRPTVEDALRRLRRLRERGPSPRAFSLLRRFTAEGAALTRTRPQVEHRLHP